MNLYKLSFIFVLSILMSCTETTQKKIRLKGNSISEKDSVLFLAYVDSSFIRFTRADTVGYSVDFLNRFSEEMGIPYRLIICKNQHDVRRKFNQGIGNLYLEPIMHDSILANDTLLVSQSLVQRNLIATPKIIFNACAASLPHVNGLAAVSYRAIRKAILSSKDKAILVESKFKMEPKDSSFLAVLNKYIVNVENRADISFLKNFYFGVSLPLNMKRYLVPRFRDGVLSPFDNLFKQAAEKYGWDWKLLAAISFKESRFNPNVVGGGGAFGLMQFMPSIGRKYGVSPNSTPQQQINAGMKLIYSAYTSWHSIPSQEQRIKFTLASYNAGKAHIDDAQRLAKKHGLNPLVWDGNVQLMVNNLSLSKYYNDDVVKFGAYHGKADRYANLVYQIYLSWKVQ